MSTVKKQKHSERATDLRTLPRPRLAPQDYDFFSTLAAAVEVFKSHDLPGANCDGCIVSPFKTNGKRFIKFVFAARAGRTVEVDIGVDDIQQNPKEYIELLLERINEACKEASKQFDTQIFLMVGSQLQRAIHQVNQTVIH